MQIHFSHVQAPKQNLNRFQGETPRRPGAVHTIETPLEVPEIRIQRGGQTVARIYGDDGGGNIELYSNTGVPKALLGSTEQGGALYFLGERGRVLTQLVPTKPGSMEMTMYNAAEKPTVRLAGDFLKRGGHPSFYGGGLRVSSPHTQIRRDFTPIRVP